jgi:hypothetical protein
VQVSGNQNTGIAILPGASGDLNLSVQDSGGTSIAGGSRTLAATANQQIVGFVKDLLPAVTQSRFSGTFTVTAVSGQISVVALQFNGAIAPVTITPLP